MTENTRGSTVAAVLACLLVVCSALAVAPGTAAAAHIDGEISYAESDGELTVEVNVQENSSTFNGTGSESVTIDIGGELVTRSNSSGNDSTYTYTVENGQLTELLSGTDGSDTIVTVSHTDEESFNETIDLQYIELDGGEGSGEFTDGRLRFPVGANFGLTDGNNVPVTVDTGDGTQNVTATYRNVSGASYLELNREALGTLEVLRSPQEITISGDEPYVRGSTTVNVANAAPETDGHRQADGTVRFESPLFESGQNYAVNITAGGAQYLRTVEAGERAIVIDSGAVAAEQSVGLTVTHVDYTDTEVVSTNILFSGEDPINGSVSDEGVVFESLPDDIKSESGNVTTVWIDEKGGYEQYHNTRLDVENLTLGNFSESPEWPTNSTTGLLLQFKNETTLYSTVNTTDSSGNETAPPGSDDGQSGITDRIPGWFWYAIAALIGAAVVAVAVVAFLAWRDSGSLRSNLPLIGSSKRTSPGTSPGASPGQKTAEMSFNVVDKEAGRAYPNADRVIATREDRGGQTRQQGVNATTNNTERISLTGSDGETELEPGTWRFEVQENGRTIGTRTHRIQPRLDSDRVKLTVDPHTIDVTVTGGPDRERLGGAMVEVIADDSGWTKQTPTSTNGEVQFTVPRSASAVRFTATHENLPPAEAEYRAEQAAQDGVTLRIADETGAMTVETMVGNRAWPEVDVQITPVSEDAKAYTDEGTVTTKSGGSRTVEGLPTGQYEISAHPQLGGVETTAARESVTVAADETVEVTLSIGIDYSMPGAHRERLGDLRERIEELTAASNRDVAIPRYYGTVLSSILDLVDEVESTPERVVAAGFSPDDTVEAVLDAVEAGVRTVDSAMSERRNVSLFGACESMSPAEVDWSGDATLEAFLDRVADGGDRGRRVLRDRLKETDDVLDQQWSEVNEIAPARKVHDRVGELAQETGDIDDDLAVVAQTYVGICLLDSVEGIFDHDALVDRLNSGSY